MSEDLRQKAKQRCRLSRRHVLKGTVGVAGISLMPGLLGKAALAQADEWTLAISMRSLANPYHATFANAGKAFAESIGAPFEMLVTEGNSEKRHCRRPCSACPHRRQAGPEHRPE